MKDLKGNELLHKGSLCLSKVEANGIKIDEAYLNSALASTAKRIKQNEETLRHSKEYKVWRKNFGDKTNLGSHAQLAEVFFKVLGHKGETYTAADNLKSDENAFAHIDSPFLKAYFENEKLKKVNGTYLKGLKRETIDGLLHPMFDLHTARTFRSSSSHPNFQNIPIRDPAIAKIIRQAFIPRENHVLVEFDYSGLEVRIAACYNKDPNLIGYIKDSTKDMHRDSAAECFKCKPKQVSKIMRYCAKNMFVFPEFYGSYYKQCAPNLWEACDVHNLTIGKLSAREHLRKKGIRTLGDCENYKAKPKKGTFEHHIQQVEEFLWKSRFHIYADWKKTWYADYLKRGWIETLTGFRIEGIYSRNDIINYPIQGSAFHCLLWSLIELQRQLEKRKMRSLIVGQIHDSIVGDVHIKELDDYLALTKKIMQKKIRKAWKWIIVPLEAEAEACGLGESWYDKKEVEM